MIIAVLSFLTGGGLLWLFTFKSKRAAAASGNYDASHASQSATVKRFLDNQREMAMRIEALNDKYANLILQNSALLGQHEETKRRLSAIRNQNTELLRAQGRLRHLLQELLHHIGDHPGVPDTLRKKIQDEIELVETAGKKDADGPTDRPQ